MYLLIISKLFSHCETCCSNNLYILNDFYIVRLGSKIEHNRTLTQFVLYDCVRFPNQVNLVVRLSSIGFDWVRLPNSSIVHVGLRSCFLWQSFPRPLAFWISFVACSLKCFGKWSEKFAYIPTESPYPGLTCDLSPKPTLSFTIIMKFPCFFLQCFITVSWSLCFVIFTTLANKICGDAAQVF